MFVISVMRQSIHEIIRIGRMATRGIAHLMRLFGLL
jgi:hypothetical protein